MKPALSVLLWPIRLVLAAVALFVSFAVLLPALGGLAGLLVGALVCAAAIAVDVVISAKLLGETVERTATKRVLLVDSIMKSNDAPPLQMPERRTLKNAETVDAEVLEDPSNEEPPQLLGPRFER